MLRRLYFAISREVVTVQQVDAIHKLILDGGISICARSVVVATGAQYRTLDLKNSKSYDNRGVYYAATAMESAFCREHEVVVVGGGNSAGQAALFLSSIARHVHHLVRGPSFAETMSQYLISRIERSSRITVYPDSEITSLEGEASVSNVSWINTLTNERTARRVKAVFVMIGAEPNTGWLYGSVELGTR